MLATVEFASFPCENLVDGKQGRIVAKECAASIPVRLSACILPTFTARKP